MARGEVFKGTRRMIPSYFNFKVAEDMVVVVWKIGKDKTRREEKGRCHVR